MQEKFQSYIIRHHTEETICAWCGWPLFVGERVVEVIRESFCSKAHAARYLADLEAEIAAEEVQAIVG